MLNSCIQKLYTVGMKNIQYTIRGIPEDLDKKLRRRAKKHKQSFNTALVQALKQGVNGTEKPAKATNDLDWFYGSGGIGEAEQQAYDEQRTVDKTAWNA